MPNTLTAWGTAAAALLTAVSLFAGGIAYAVHLRDDASSSKASEADHESRLRNIETRLTQIAVSVERLSADVCWIRQNTPAARSSAGGADQTASR